MSLLGSIVAAVRLHRRRPAFAIVSILAIGFAIAINVTVFAVLDAVRTPSPPIEDPNTLVAPGFFSATRSPSAPRLFAEALASSAPSFVQVTSFEWDGSRILAESARNWRDVYAFTVADNFFAVLRPRPEAGRMLGPADSRVGASMVVISSVVERSLFPSGESAVGKEIKLAGQPVTVVGVLPRRAAYPEFAEVWRLGLPTRTAGQFLLARLSPTAIFSQARNELDHLRSRIDPAGTSPRNESRVELKLAFASSARLKAFHWAMLSAAVAVLLVACFNVANLQFSRGFERASELALRTAVGATQRQLFGHLLAEVLVLAVLGGIVGLLLGAWGVKIFGSSVPVLGTRGLVEPQWSWRVFFGAGFATTVSLAVSGMVSGLTLSKMRFANAFRSGPGAGIGRQERRASSVLLVGQIALSLALCIHSTLLTRAVIKLQQLEIGFETDHLVTGAVTLRTAPVNTREPRAKYATELAQRLRALPNAVDAATIVRSAPAAGDGLTAEYRGGSLQEFPVSRWVYQSVTPSYFRTLGVRVSRGRDFHEEGESTPVAIINERAARQWWPREDPIGRMVKLGREQTDAAWVRVVGVVPDIRLTPSLEEEPPPLLVMSHSLDTTAVSNSGYVTLSFVARSRASAANFALLVRQIGGGSETGAARRTWASDWESAKNIDTLKARERFVATLFWTFTFLALALALIGVYSLTSYTVSRRQTELGVRLALGASPSSLILERLRESNLIAMLGIAVGLVFAAWSVELLDTFLLGLEPFEPVLFGIVAVIMLLVVLLAALPSALRSGAVDPVEALRST